MTYRDPREMPSGLVIAGFFFSRTVNSPSHNAIPVAETPGKASRAGARDETGNKGTGIGVAYVSSCVRGTAEARRRTACIRR